VDDLAKLLGSEHGPCNVFLHYRDRNAKEVTVHATSACMVRPSRGLREKVEALVGAGGYWCSAGFGLPSHNLDTGDQIMVEPKPWERARFAG